MNQNLIDAVEKCLRSMEAGVPLEDCIKEYPDLAPEINDILVTAKDVMSLRGEQVPIESLNQSRKKLLAGAKLLLSKDKPNTSSSIINRLFKPVRQILQGFSSLSPLAGRLVFAFGIAGLLILFSGGLLITSAKSLPGDSFYPVKRAVEGISVHLVPNNEFRSEYEDSYSQQRVAEVKRLIDLKRIQRISFEGILESITNSSWIVSGIPVNLQGDTAIVGGFNGAQSFELGSVVEVEGVTNAQGWVAANEIHLREYQFIGMVEKIDAKSWQISGIQFLITSRTQIDPGIRVDDDATVLIRSEDNGLYALAILREVHPTTTPNTPQSIPAKPIPSENPSPNTEEDHQILGTLNNITGSYWVISGHIIYIVGDTHISGDIKIGDSLSVNYRVEPNGSSTAIEIDKIDNVDHPEEYQSQETPEAGGESDGHETLIVSSSADDEKDKRSETHEYQETPEPTDDH
jgi:hypothetical protein